MFEWLSKRFHPTPRPSHALDLASLPAIKPLTDAPLATSRLVVLDLETTGLNPKKDQVIAVGAVAIDHLEIPLDDQFDLVLQRPELDISETVLIHGIGPEALRYGQQTEDALFQLLQWINGDPVLAFHAAFDRQFLNKALKQVLGYRQSHIWLDVAELMPTLFPDTETGGRRLDNWADHFGLEASARHHAGADAMVTAEMTLIALDKAAKRGLTTLPALQGKLRYYRRINAIHQR
ncbi:PolC-type DNA polymerase III [Marinobacter sp. X15-166B]|uniref:3'-5' exonuclease n=1 Tax=Marinobacter sp. X15-166B TaxID=1897620 RepID=UPI00085BD2B5|nr:3'-5' exonuclease [Marinobacter sp. X15-166B]OEY67833.1 DNA polymerase III subunit epsilon [Marinobacter sp. X15-166B]